MALRVFFVSIGTLGLLDLVAGQILQLLHIRNKLFQSKFGYLRLAEIFETTRMGLVPAPGIG